MSINNLLNVNDYKLFLNAENLKIDGDQPKGTILSSDGSDMKNVAPGSEGFVLKARSSENAGVAWEAPGAGDGNIYENDGTITDPVRTIDCGTGRLVILGDNPNQGVLGIQRSDNGDAALITFRNSNGGGESAIYQEPGGGGGLAIRTGGVGTPSSLGTAIRFDGSSRVRIAQELRFDTLPTSGNEPLLLAMTPAGVVQTRNASTISDNIYNTDSTLSGNRTVDCDDNELNLDNASFMNITSNSGLVVETGLRNIITTTAGEAGISAVEFGDSNIGTTLSGGSYVLNPGGIPFDTDQFFLTVDITDGTVRRRDIASIPERNVFTQNGTIPAATTRRIFAGDLSTKLEVYPVLSIEGDLRLGDTAPTGSILKGNGTTYEEFPRGTASQILRTVGNDLSWVSQSYSEMFLNATANVTTITTQGTFVKAVANGTQAGLLSSDWTVTTTGNGNRLTYTGDTKIFKITCSVSGIAGNKYVGCRICKNGNAASGSKTQSNDQWGDNSTTKRGNCNPQGLFEMSTNDYLEVFVANLEGTGNITLTNLNFIAMWIS